jgi:hypothetical protein
LLLDKNLALVTVLFGSDELTQENAPMKWLSKWFSAVAMESRQLRRRGLCLEVLEDRAVPTLLYWNPQGGSTDWNTATNWKPGDHFTPSRVPSIDDIAIFNATSTSNCTLSGTGTCEELQVTSDYTGTINLNQMTLMMLDTTTGTSNLNGGSIQGGTLSVGSGTLDLNGTSFAANLVVGPGSNTDRFSAYVMIHSDIQSWDSFTPSVTVVAGGRVDVLGTVTISENINVNNGGTFWFTQSAQTVSIGQGSVITVASGGVLDLETPVITATDSSSYISNSGTVQKTGSGETDVYLGLRNEASTALLTISGGTDTGSSTLYFKGVLPGTTTSLY